MLIETLERRSLFSAGAAQSAAVESEIPHDVIAEVDARPAPPATLTAGQTARVGVRLTNIGGAVKDSFFVRLRLVAVTDPGNPELASTEVGYKHVDRQLRFTPGGSRVIPFRIETPGYLPDGDYRLEASVDLFDAEDNTENNTDRDGPVVRLQNAVVAPVPGVPLGPPDLKFSTETPGLVGRGRSYVQEVTVSHIGGSAPAKFEGTVDVPWSRDAKFRGFLMPGETRTYKVRYSIDTRAISGESSFVISLKVLGASGVVHTDSDISNSFLYADVIVSGRRAPRGWGTGSGSGSVLV